MSVDLLADEGDETEPPAAADEMEPTAETGDSDAAVVATADDVKAPAEEAEPVPEPASTDDAAPDRPEVSAVEPEAAPAADDTASPTTDGDVDAGAETVVGGDDGDAPSTEPEPALEPIDVPESIEVGGERAAGPDAETAVGEAPSGA